MFCFVKKLQTYSIYFRGKSYLEEESTQNYLVFQSIYRYFQRVGNSEYTYSWKSKAFYKENILPPTTTVYSLTSKLSYFGTKTKVKFSGSCLKTGKIAYNHGKIVNI